MAKLLNITKNITVAFLLVLSFVMLVLSLPASGWKALSVQTGSMKPAIMPGDLVLAHSVPVHDLHVGDVITYISPKNNRQTITHRIAEIKTVPNGPGRFITKGDANKSPDPVVYQSQIVGTSKLTIPKVGFVFDWLRTWLGLAVVVYLPSLLIVIAETRRLARYYKEMEPYTINGFNPKQHKPSNVKRIAKAGSLATIAATVVAVPVTHAALLSTATLSNNIISSVPSQALNHLVISNVSFGNSGSTSNSTTINVTNNNPQTATSGNATGNNATSGNASNSSNSSFNFTVSNSGGGSSTPPTVTIYNPTDSPIPVSGWTLSDNNSTRTLSNNTVVGAKASYVFVWPQTGGLDKVGDRLILRSDPSTIIDALSWGTDTTQLNPAIVIASGNTTITRSDPNVDSDAASDWTAS